MYFNFPYNNHYKTLINQGGGFPAQILTKSHCLKAQFPYPVVPVAAMPKSYSIPIFIIFLANEPQSQCMQSLFSQQKMGKSFLPPSGPSYKTIVLTVEIWVRPYLCREIISFSYRYHRTQYSL